jgi:starch synthase/alpha-amylase
MPSRFEPCGLPQMIAPIYGSLPVAHDTGGIHDTVRHLNAEADTGNGFLFKTFDGPGFFWAIEEAMRFYSLPAKVRARQINRIMTEAVETFTYEQSARHYIELYEKMLQRQLVVD